MCIRVLNVSNTFGGQGGREGSCACGAGGAGLIALCGSDFNPKVCFVMNANQRYSLPTGTCIPGEHLLACAARAWAECTGISLDRLLLNTAT